MPSFSFANHSKKNKIYNFALHPLNMKLKLLTIFFLISGFSIHAQNPDCLSSFAPFLNGVASGDPLNDRVIIWTRVTPQNSADVFNVQWRMATDTGMTQLVNSGNATADSSKDFTVKIDVTGLSPDTWYYYDFSVNGNSSIKGRTRTTPDSPKNELRFAVATCAKYVRGFFNSYNRVAARNDIDAVIHLGDYIYESYTQSDIGREWDPPHDCASLDDFRRRHRQYKTDIDLIAAHQQYPWICVWDDHEFNNDAWLYGGDDFDSAEFVLVKANALKAYFEYMPVREHPQEYGKIWRKISYGSLMDLIMLDTRMWGREKHLEFADSTINDPNRTLLGHDQFNWLINQLDSSEATWRIIGQQVVMSPLKAFGSFVNNDQWDGFPAERERLLNHIKDSNMNNVMVLTGDVHSPWALDMVPDSDSYNPSTGSGSVAVEFVTPAIASSPSDYSNFPVSLIQLNNPHTQYVELVHNGYTILTVRPDRAQCDLYFANNTQAIDTTEFWDSGWFTVPGQKHWLENNTALAPQNTYPQQAPFPCKITSVYEVESALKFSDVFPNPGTGIFSLKISSEKEQEITVRLLDLTGNDMLRKKTHKLRKGENTIHLDLREMPSQVYFLQINGAGFKAGRKVVLSR